MKSLEDLKKELEEKGLLDGVERELLEAQILAKAEAVDGVTFAVCGACGNAKGEAIDAWLKTAAPHVIVELIEAKRRVEQELIEREHSFDLRWNADMRAIKLWQKATGRTEVWPDHADLCVWLMEKLDRVKSSIIEDLDEVTADDLEYLRDACQQKLDDLKDTWDDAAETCP